MKKKSQMEKSRFPWILFLLIITFFILAALERTVARGFVSHETTVQKSDPANPIK